MWASVTSPRSADMGPMHFLRILDPSLRDKDVVHPDMMAAQDRLAEKQIEAERIIIAEPDVEDDEAAASRVVQAHCRRSRVSTARGFPGSSSTRRISWPP